MLILQYLQDEGYLASRMTIHDETNVKYRELDDKLSDIKASLFASLSILKYGTTDLFVRD